MSPIVLESGNYSDLPSISKVFNRAEIVDTLSIHLNLDFTNLILYQIDNLSTNSLLSEVEFDSTSVQQLSGKPWVDIDSQLLELTNGYHIYKLSFVHTKTHEVYACFFAYTIQSSDDYKPYLYMDRK